MLVKAQVQSTDGDSIKISIPSLEVKTIESPISVPPGCVPNLEKGQIVYASFINNDRNRPIILGALQSQSSSSKLFDISVNNVSASMSARLPKNFSASNVDYKSISNIINVNSGIQQELNNILNYIDDLFSKISKLKKKNDENLKSSESLQLDIDNLDLLISELNELLGSPSDNKKKTVYGKLNELEKEVADIESKVGSFDFTQDFKTIIDGLEESLNNIQYISSGDYCTDPGEFSFEPLDYVPKTWEDKCLACFGKVYEEKDKWWKLPYSTIEAANKHMKAFNCPLWCLDSNGKKYESSRTTWVHEATFGLFESAFNEIHEIGEQMFTPGVGNVWAYEYEHGGEHRVGTAIDVNPASNPYVQKTDSRCKNYRFPTWATNDPCSVPVERQFDSIMAKYGFKRGIYWGGDMYDYMHYSFFGW